LTSLPQSLQKQILDKLQPLDGIRNPSAWVAKAALAAGAEPQNGAEPRLGLDANATALLAKLSQDQQVDITTKLQELQASGQVKNPSGWVVKSALNAGAKADPSVVGARSGARVGATVQPTPVVANTLVLTPSLGLDRNAAMLLAQLPLENQADITAKLQELRMQGQVKNPSGWVVKAALNAGAKANGTPSPQQGFVTPLNLIQVPPLRQVQATVSIPFVAQRGTALSLGLDQSAAALLAQLPLERQADISAKLQELRASGQVKNPSGWVVKAALNAGARAEAGAAPSKLSQSQRVRAMPY